MEDELRTTRWWPLFLILGGLAARLGWIWSGGSDQQMLNIETLVACIIATLLTLIWLLAFSRLPGMVRVLMAALLAIAGAFASRFLTIDGVTGDWVPRVAFKTTGSEGSSDVPIGVADGAGPLEAGPGDWPQFLGPGRDGAATSGVALSRDWDASPPVELWRRPVGPGWSGYAVVGRFAVTQEQREGDELVTARDKETGELLWEHGNTTRFESTLYGDGPRATPTIDGGRVYALGATGILDCLELASGALVWSRNIVEDANAPSKEWGFTGSPLVAGGKVMVSAGGPGNSMLAYDHVSGELQWGVGGDASAYSSPTVATLAGVPQVLILNAAAITSHALASGEIQWTAEWSDHQPNVMNVTPLGGDRVLVSSGYDVGATVFEITAGDGGAGLQATKIWSKNTMKAKFTNVVQHDGFIYGLDDGRLACVDAATGERLWKRGRYRQGQLLLAGDLLVIQAEEGYVALVEATPEEHRELGRLEALESKTWNNPALAGDLLLVRNDREAACYRLPLAAPLATH